MSDTPNEIQRSSRKNPLVAVRSHLIDSLHRLNLFKDHPFWTPNLNYSEQIISTRLTLLFISLSLIILITYSTLTIVTHQIILNEFSLDDFERLEKLHPETIDVPCSQISIPYKEFLHLSPKVHQVCSSAFIGNEWISSLYLFNATRHNLLDFRRYGFAHYRSLRLLCRLARQTVKDAHRIFNSTYLTNRYTFSRKQFTELSSVLFDNFHRNILINEKQTINMISMITARSGLMSALQTNYYIQAIPGTKEYLLYDGLYLVPNQTDDWYCDCRLESNQCFYPAGVFYNWTLRDVGQTAKNDPPPLFEIPGLMAGCTPLDSIRQSTLECLYNQTCIDRIAIQPEISRPTALNQSLTRFPIDWKIGSLFDDYLFVESWENQSNFEDYFSVCSPKQLSYSYQGRLSLWKFLLLIIAASAALFTYLKLSTPVLIKFFHLIKRENKEQTLPKGKSLHRYEVVTTVYHLNLFPSDHRDNPSEEHFGILATRLYIFFYSLTVIIYSLIIYFSKHNEMIRIDNPSALTFEELHRKYSSTLNCPCSHFSMSYNRLMSVSPRYHSICSSDFLKDNWKSYFNRLNMNTEGIYLMTTDFRAAGLLLFGLVDILCQTSNETIENALFAFRNNRLVTMNALLSNEFHFEIQRRLKTFEEQTFSSFVHLIELIRSAIQINQLVEGMWTNVVLYSQYDNETSQWSLGFRSRDFYRNSCSCGLSSECIRPLGFYSKPTEMEVHPNITVPGFVVACHPMDSVFLSTLECLYQKECLQFLIDKYDLGVEGFVRPLDDGIIRIKALSNENSRFLINETIGEIFSQLFIEEWINSSNYSSYYQRCQPSQCTYIILRHFHLSYMITKTLAFCGGLNAVLDLIAPFSVKLFRQQWKRRNTDQSMDDSNVRKYRRFRSWNIFSSSVEPHLTRAQIFATRIYIFFLLLFMIIALLYYGPFSRESKAITYENPSMDLVDHLNQKNLSDLSCPCSKVAIPYSKFLSIEPQIHSICSSEMISPLYRLDLFKKNDSQSLEIITHYRILSTFCSLSKEYLKNMIEVLDHQEFVTIETLSNTSFDREMKSLVKNFRRRIQFDYRRRILSVMNSFNINQLLHLFTRNWKINFTNEDENYIIDTIPQQFSSTNCTCAISADCHEQLVDQIEIGCFPYDGFRFSKYQNISFETLHNRLFVEQWHNRSNYSNYFYQCQPLKCQYTIADKTNFPLILTNLIEVYGGRTFFFQ